MTLVGYRRMGAMRPINRIKHVVDSSGTVTAAATLASSIVNAKDAPVLANVTEVQTGSKVNGIYLHVEVSPNETDAGAIPNVYMAVYKSPSGLAGTIDPTNVGANDLKKFVIHQEMVMMNNLAGGNPRTLFNGVIVIPRGMRRFGPDDTLVISARSTAVNFAICWQAHYKEFR